MVLPQGHRGNPGLMPRPSEILAALAPAPMRTPNVHRRLQNSFFALQALNSLASAYYFNYLFFYMEEHFGFDNRDNLLVSALYGLGYMIVSGYAGQFAQKRGCFFTLYAGFGGMGFFMALGALAPLVLGYSHSTMLLEWVILALWTPSISITWPTLQALLNEQAPGEGSRTAGIYNMVWAGAAAVAYFTSGMLLDHLGREALFWVPAVLHAIQLIMLPGLKKIHDATPVAEPAAVVQSGSPPPLNRRSLSKTRTFVSLARVANPFAYVAIYGVLPVAPKISEHFGLTPAQAGQILSVWMWVRLGGFVWFWLWSGWHYRFRWLMSAFIGLIGSYAVILLGSQIWMLVAAQVVFGLATSLIYYSSLFYSMDLGESKGSRSGFHEAAIGLGIFIGPVAGVAGLKLFPQEANAATWSIAALLVCGLGLFLYIRARRQG
jgi:predicted MFS family arabinose efflux permease